MRTVNHDPAYLWDMLDAAKTACQLTQGMTYQQYQQDRKLQLAIERLVEIIGEAARNISKTFTDAHAEIPWRKIIAQRHVLAHDYGDIAQEKMWILVTQNIPELIASLETLLPPTPSITEL